MERTFMVRFYSESGNYHPSVIVTTSEDPIIDGFTLHLGKTKLVFLNRIISVTEEK